MPRARPNAVPDESESYGFEIHVADLPPEFERARAIGGGGFGRVFRADWLVNGTRVDVAVKAHLRSDFNDREHGLSPNFTHELRVCALVPLDSRHLVRTLGIRAPNHRYIVMEYWGNSDTPLDLQRYIDRAAAEPKAKLDVAVQLAAGLCELHRLPVAHGDLKPSNVLLKWLDLEKRFHARIGDLGSARLLNDDAEHELRVAAATAAFKAPELDARVLHTRASDVYSLGLTVFRMFGIKVAQGDPVGPQTARIVAYQVIDGGRAVPEETLDQLSALLAAAVSPEPDDRPSADRLYSALTDLHGQLWGEWHPLPVANEYLGFSRSQREIRQIADAESQRHRLRLAAVASEREDWRIGKRRGTSVASIEKILQGFKHERLMMIKLGCFAEQDSHAATLVRAKLLTDLFLVASTRESLGYQLNTCCWRGKSLDRLREYTRRGPLAMCRFIPVNATSFSEYWPPASCCHQRMASERCAPAAGSFTKFDRKLCAWRRAVVEQAGRFLEVASDLPRGVDSETLLILEAMSGRETVLASRMFSVLQREYQEPLPWSFDRNALSMRAIRPLDLRLGPLLIALTEPLHASRGDECHARTRALGEACGVDLWADRREL